MEYRRTQQADQLAVRVLVGHILVVVDNQVVDRDNPAVGPIVGVAAMCVVAVGIPVPDISAAASSPYLPVRPDLTNKNPMEENVWS